MPAIARTTRTRLADWPRPGSCICDKLPPVIGVRTIRTRPRLALGVLAALLLVAGFGVYEYRHSTHSTPVSEQRALARFHAAQGDRPGALRPRPGVYAYAVDGWECAGVGPLCLRRALPPRAYLVVSQRGSTLQLELDLSAEHRESARYDVRAGARYETWQDTLISFAGVAQESAVATVPATLALPAVLTVGRRWTQRFHVSKLPVRSDNRVLRRETVSVAGRPVGTYVVASDSVTGGAHPGTERDVAWHAPALGLDLRQTISRRIGGAFPYRLEATATLERLAPAT